ncbi:histidine kinase dimerization/phosphoacceptor domain -containing protein [Fluviicola sp.]|uniref:histidine kinase dimerization/phosphoacceptor domain -containing protein n=1 Tax=Fluviicola sp. TaxID=1917219 RepID=UPI002630718D|nr:histidine kinase dimerization/phosphoacceptor domain -containing protein [Fluviicola sp.]
MNSFSNYLKPGGRKQHYIHALRVQRINTDSALIYIDLAFQEAKKSHNINYQGEVSLSKARIHLLRGEIDLAIEYGLQSHKYYSQKKNHEGISKANLLLAQAYSIIKEKKKSDECLKLAENYAQSNKQHQMLIEALICRGNTCFQFGKYAAAMKYYKDAKQKMKRIVNPYLETKINNNIANILMNTGNTPEALKIYKKAIVQYRKINQPLDELLILYNIGRQYREVKMIDSSLYYNNLCLSLALKVHSLEDITYSYSGLKESYQILGDYKTALHYNELMNVYQDSLQMNANKVRIARLEADYELRRGKEIIQIQKRKLILTKRKTTFALLALFIASSLIILGLFYFRKSRKLNQALKQSNAEIREQNKTIDKALHEKEVLLKEVHHRVKNSLQIVSSLLNLQESQLTDEIAIDALRNSKIRIQTIALMHQSLYQSDADLGRVNSASYLQNILSLQLQALSVKTKQIETYTDFEDLELSIDQAVPLGLIASELINNALKHAYKETKNPHLSLITKMVDNELLLKISDNGSGFESNDFRNHFSLGLEIVEALNNQLHGKMECPSTPKGTSFTFLFPLE